MSQTRFHTAAGMGTRQLPDHAIEMRWSDLDILDHVNNVVYLEYVDDAITALGSELGTDKVLASCEIEYVHALELTQLPVLVTSRLSGELLEQEVVVDHTTGRTVHARVRSQLVTERKPITPMPEPWRSVGFQLRARDLDGPRMRNAAVFGLFQEGRILSLGRHQEEYPGGRVVVARSSVRYAAPIPMHDEPYEIRSVILRMGRASVTMRLQLDTPGSVLAEAESTFVGFDVESKRSRAFSEEERAYMLAHVPMILR